MKPQSNNPLATVEIKDVGKMDWLHQPVHFVLGNDEAHIYRICISDHLQHLDRLSLWLNPEEKVRGNKYHQLKDRQRFVVSRGVQRFLLAQYAGEELGKLEFALGDNKKPFLAGSRLQYNITHAGDYILLGVNYGLIGADVEHVDRNFEYADILPANFSSQEIAYIQHENSQERFFRLWTRKEAFLKATAQGLGEHLIDTPSLDGNWQLPVNIDTAGRNWHLATFNVDDHHLGSIAYESTVRSVEYFDFNLKAANR